MRISNSLIAVVFMLASAQTSGAQVAAASSGGGQQAQDPGVRGGAAGAGQPIEGMAAGELYFFKSVATATFNEVENVASGLGPRFNLNSCSGCHAYPAVGGSSPSTNPEVAH